MNEQDQADAKKRVAKLSPAQTQVLVYMAKGFSSPEIGKLTHRSASTIDAHRYKIFDRLEVSSACEAAVIAAKAGLA